MSDSKDTNNDGDVTAREHLGWWKRRWQSTPRTIRRSIVAVIGATLVLLGLALVVLPGPFTLPLVIAGFAVLGSEFAWAHRLLETGKQHASKAGERIRRTLGRRQ